MSVDFFLYISLIFFGAIYTFNHSKKIFFLYFSFLLIFIVAIRMDPKGVDFVTYYQYLHNVDGIRYYREVVYFSIGLGFFKLFNDEVITFIFMDFIWIYILFKIQKEINLKFNTTDNVLIVILFTSFPLFFGYENIYRQLFAEIFSLYAYVVRERNESKSNFLFLIAILMHNTALIILPFLLIKKISKLDFKTRLYISTIVSIVFGLLLSFMSQYKASAHNTGLDMAFIYYLLFFMLNYIYLIKNKFNIVRVVEKFPSIYLGLILMTFLIQLPVGMISERIGMFFLVFVITDLYIYSINMTTFRKKLFRLGLLMIFSLPVIAFTSSRVMLL